MPPYLFVRTPFPGGPSGAALPDPSPPILIDLPACNLQPSNYPDFMNPKIELNPEVCNGRPVIRRTRITVETILGYLGAGDTVDDVLEAHPSLERADVLACINHARCLSSARSFIHLAS